MDNPVTRAELREVADLAEVALIIALKLASEHGLCDAPAGNEDAIHDRLERLGTSRLALDSMDLGHALRALAKIVPRNEL